jgi:hypothetical protein
MSYSSVGYSYLKQVFPDAKGVSSLPTHQQKIDKMCYPSMDPSAKASPKASPDAFGNAEGFSGNRYGGGDGSGSLNEEALGLHSSSDPNLTVANASRQPVHKIYSHGYPRSHEPVRKDTHVSNIMDKYLPAHSPYKTVARPPYKLIGPKGSEALTESRFDTVPQSIGAYPSTISVADWDRTRTESPLLAYERGLSLGGAGYHHRDAYSRDYMSDCTSIFSHLRACPSCRKAIAEMGSPHSPRDEEKRYSKIEPFMDSIWKLVQDSADISIGAVILIVILSGLSGWMLCKKNKG